MERFWTFDSSPYVREKLAHGHRMGRRHCHDMSMWTRMHWKSFFAEWKLGNLSKADLKAFSLWLAESKNLKPKAINNILAAGTVALRWAAERGHRLQPGCRPGEVFRHGREAWGAHRGRSAATFRPTMGGRARLAPEHTGDEYRTLCRRRSGGASPRYRRGPLTRSPFLEQPRWT